MGTPLSLRQESQLIKYINIILYIVLLQPWNLILNDLIIIYTYGTYGILYYIYYMEYFYYLLYSFVDFVLKLIAFTLIHKKNGSFCLDIFHRCIEL